VIPARFQPVLQELAPLTERFRAAGFRLFLVGGTVRDLLTGDATVDTAELDFDATTDARPADIKRVLDGWADAVWSQGERFGTIGAKRRGPHGDRFYEITTHRAEAYQPDSRKPDVQFSDHVEADLSRRDFTINAMALELTADSPTLVDPFVGRPICSRARCAHSQSDGELQRRPAAHAQGGAVHRPPRSDARAGSRRCRSGHARPSGHRLGERIRDELDKLITLPHRLRACGSPSTRVSPMSSCRSYRRCVSSRTRSIATRTC